MKKNICIVGTGGFAREVLCLIDDLKLYNDVCAFLEPDHIWEKEWKGKEIMGIPVLNQSSFDPEKSFASIGIGDPIIREKVTKQLPQNTEYKSLIHPNAVISRWSTIEEGAVICAGSIITSQIKIGKHAHINLDTTIGHDCTIGNFFTTAPSVNISGICDIGDYVYFGTGSATRQGVKINSNITVGMGAMVVKDLNEAGIYVGIPAKKIK